MVLET